MHVLLVAQWPRRFSPGNFQWPNDTAQAFRRLGHRVTTCCNRESWAESPAITARLGAGGASPAWLMRWHAAGQRRRDRRVVTLVQQHRPDLVLLLNGALISAEGLREVRRATSGCLVSWWADDPWLDAAFMASVDVFDHVCVFDRAYIPRLRSAGAAQVHFLPCACNERVYGPLRLRPMEQRRFACDVSFVGWYYPERGPVMGALAQDADVQLGIWGGQWNSPEAQRALHGASVVRGAAVSDRTAAKIYNASKIGINVHARHSLLAGVNTRTFELLASGLFQLVDRIDGMEELLAPGREVVCYTSPEEARVLARRYLADPAERAAIAARGRERTLAEHTYVCRMRTLLNVASS
jgi:spore maturation protein CgeB